MGVWVVLVLEGVSVALPLQVFVLFRLLLRYASASFQPALSPTTLFGIALAILPQVAGPCSFHDRDSPLRR